MGKIQAGEALVRCLSKWGIDHVYGMPGGSIDRVVESLRKHKDEIDFYLVRHEEVASLAASSYAKLTGKIGVCLAINGPGAIHLLGGMYDAKLDHVPMLVLVGHTVTTLTGTDYFQEMNMHQLFEDVAVYNKVVASSETLPIVINQAIRSAYQQRGVSVVMIPDDLVLGEIPDDEMQLSTIFEEKKPGLNSDDLSQAVTLINKSKNPVILAGVGAKYASAELVDLAERISAPVAISLRGKGGFPDLHPNFLGNIGRLGTKPAYEAMKSADLLLLIGTDYPYQNYLPDHAKCVQIDIDPIHLGKRYAVNVGILGDAADALNHLTEHLIPVSDRPFLKHCQENMSKWRKWIEEDKKKTQSPIAPEAVMSAIEGIAEDDAIFSVDVGTATIWAPRYLNLNKNQDFIVSSWLGMMGCGVPGAMAAKHAYPDRQAIAICGDGGFAMVMQDFATAVQYKWPIIVVILNNRQLGFIKYEQQSAGELNYGIDMQDINFAQVAQACGGKGMRVETFDQLHPAFQEARTAQVPVLLDILVDQNDAPLPGKIISAEMQGYAAFTAKSLIETHKLEDPVPPVKELVRRLF
ncbi:pyruvate oxidase [Sporolactobacillus shoreicorticis]|uniref:Pyruvate oxidase n=1 Tax=Sporolactobacillus shoreicorticis TaxID=1923877 RepID=A0ABW5S6A0_9BACL|nr:pyruvate oxidase [Sporolactobacillus shoreicorticis]MCO7125663.1 pyruvate oxidase [Sporolactobacillus shoreicorticis]